MLQFMGSQRVRHDLVTELMVGKPQEGMGAKLGGRMGHPWEILEGMSTHIECHLLFKPPTQMTHFTQFYQ